MGKRLFLLFLAGAVSLGSCMDSDARNLKNVQAGGVFLHSENQEDTLSLQDEEVSLTGLKVIKGDHQIRLEWNCNYEDCLFKISRSNRYGGDYTVLEGEVGSAYFYDYDIKPGVPYYYKIEVEGYYRGVTDEEGDYDEEYIDGSGCKPLVSGKVQVFLEKPKLIKAVQGDSKSVKLTWNQVQGADGYAVYRSTEKSGAYKKVGTKKQSTSFSYSSVIENTFKDKNLTLGKTYYYKVVPYAEEDGKKYENLFSSKKSVVISIEKTKITKASSNQPGCNTIVWKKNSQADGYLLSVSTKLNGKYKMIKKIKGKGKTSYTHKKLTNGKAYYYKVTSYKKVKGKTMTRESDAFLKYCDYYGYEQESYTSRCKRIFGKTYYADYANSAQAAANMRTITIQVWDQNAGSGKYTRSVALTVNKNIAPTIQQMFREIYNSSEKFPIHDIGCYSWRGDTSNSEHCEGLAIDINANENYMIDGGRVLAGSFWRPGSNPYSIPLKCELVKIMNKYGFIRGFWGDRKDYMHFSYFGT